MNNYTLEIRSNDETLVSQTTGNFSVSIPYFPDAAYECEINYMSATLTNNVPYALQIKCEEITRHLSTKSSNDGWCTACIFSGLSNAPVGKLYFSKAPKLMSLRIVAQSDGSTISNPTVHNWFLLHFKKIQ